MNNFNVILGDCKPILAELPSKGVAIIGDPPYGINYIPKQRTGRGQKFDPIRGDNEPFDPSHLLRFETLVLWGANHYADKLPPSRGWLVWDKRNGTPSDNGSDCELAWTNRDQVARMFSYLWRGIVKEKQNRDEKGPRLHPNQKPVALYKWLIELLDLPRETLIVDPYMGSGSCGVAAAELGYKYLGIEIDPRYFYPTQERISRAYAQPILIEVTA